MDGCPNIIWITLESVRADHVPLYGYHRDTTPRLRQESERSDAVVISNPVSQSMWTPAATASILTGTYLSTHQLGQAGTAQRRLRSELKTLPRLLRKKGYNTALFTPNAYIGSSTGLDRGFDHTERLTVDKREFLPGTDAWLPNWQSAIRRIAELSEVSLTTLKNDIGHNPTATVPARFRRWERRRDSEQPFFAYVHLDAPHHPYRPVSKFQSRFFDELDITPQESAEIVRDLYAGSTTLKRRMANGLNITERQWGGIEALYDAEVRFADAIAGKLLTAAREATGREMVAIVTGDHGDLFGEYGLVGHNLVLHDGLIRVPLVLTGIEGVVDGPEMVTQHIDVTRTLAEMTGVSAEQFDGRDLRGQPRHFGVSQRGVAQLHRYRAFNEAFDVPDVGSEPMSAVRTAAEKYIESDGTRALYKLPDEKTNRIDEDPYTAERLAAHLTEQGISWTPVETKERAGFSETTKQRLHDLGYITE